MNRALVLQFRLVAFFLVIVWAANAATDTGSPSQANSSPALIPAIERSSGTNVDSYVRENNGTGLNFYGFYADASWYLTGESRPYDQANGYFKRLVPRRNFDFGRGGAWGTFELAARFSYTDLNDANVFGGRMSLVMGELNWYLHSHVRWMFNAGYGHISGGLHHGDLVLFQSRIGVDF
jgi:hypothetical protein